MNQKAKPGVPGWYWVTAAVALLWNLLGCAAFGMEIFAQEAMMESMTEDQKEWARSIPGWIYFVYGLATNAISHLKQKSIMNSQMASHGSREEEQHVARIRLTILHDRS